jgi:hypothetical protein
MALTAAREIPARSASSACDHSRAARRASTGLHVMILSFIDIIVSFRGAYCKRHAKRGIIFVRVTKTLDKQRDLAAGMNSRRENRMGEIRPE